MANTRRITTTPKTYYTRHNFSRPYRVVIDGRTVRVYDNDDNDENEDNHTTDTPPIRTYTAKQVWIGRSETCEFTTGSASTSSTPPQRQPEYDGNSILLRTGQHAFVHIGATIETLTFTDTVDAFWSPVSSSGDVPQPLIVGKRRVCFVDAVGVQEVPRKRFPTGMGRWCDAPLYYWGRREGLPGGMRKY